jgi:hypothetical protein
MADITLISGSTLGGAEYVAEHLAEKLEDAGFSTQTLHGPLLEDLPTDAICRITCNLYMTNCWNNSPICQTSGLALWGSAAVNMTLSVAP